MEERRNCLRHGTGQGHQQRKWQQLSLLPHSRWQHPLFPSKRRGQRKGIVGQHGNLHRSHVLLRRSPSMGVNQDFPKGTHKSIHLSCGDTMVFPDIFPERRTVRKQLELSGRNLRDSRYEHLSIEFYCLSAVSFCFKFFFNGRFQIRNT